MVNKSFMYRFFNSSKLNVITPVIKDSLDTFCLFFAVATDKQTITIGHILLEALTQQVKILVEDWLYISIKRE